MLEYYVLTDNAQFESVIEFIRQHNLPHSIHLNRTRFSVPRGAVHTEFLLRFSEHCARVDSQSTL